jgi:uncharacterized protein
LEKTNIPDLKTRLEGWFDNIQKAAIALSGGIDSSLIAYVAKKQLGKENVIAIISASASVKQKELSDARSFCSMFDINLLEVDAREIDDERYRENPINRCYFCKSALYTKLEEIISDRYIGYTVLNGNNFSDMGDFRPGLKAAGEHLVRSPLAECQFTKDDIRALSQYYQLPNWNKPASPCLSSRFPYGENITEGKLRMVEEAEDTLNHFGFNNVRVRYITTGKSLNQGKIARIEVPAEEIEKLRLDFSEIELKLNSIGFEQCEIDTEGLVSGKLNRKVTS